MDSLLLSLEGGGAQHGAEVGVQHDTDVAAAFGVQHDTDVAAVLGVQHDAEEVFGAQHDIVGGNYLL